MGINKPQIGVLAVQGAFIEHERILKSLGAEVFEIRQLRDLNRRLDGLVLPGGESTVQGKLQAKTRRISQHSPSLFAGMLTEGSSAASLRKTKSLTSEKCRRLLFARPSLNQSAKASKSFRVRQVRILQMLPSKSLPFATRTKLRFRSIRNSIATQAFTSIF